MKGSGGKRGIFVEIGRKLATSKPASRRQSLSFASNLPAIATPVNQTQPMLPSRRKISQPCPAGNINDDFLFMRKENYLNTKFNIRKNKLKEITRENRQLHERITSQKSLYSSSELNKSFQSTSEIKSRLSHSKLSQRLNSSRSSHRSKPDSAKPNRFQRKQEPKIAIKTTNINTTEANDLQSFKALFRNEAASVKNEPRREHETYSFKSHRQDDAYRAPPKMPIRSSTEKQRSAIEKQQSSNAYNEGGLLHRIAEEMISGAKQGGKRAGKNKKMFHF